MSKDFNKLAFEALFVAALARLTASEMVSKAELKVLSRSTLEAVHATGDIAYVNRLLAVLSPMNKKVAVIFFKHFTGFVFDDVLGGFAKKSKKRYDEAVNNTDEFLADPLNNIWTWAARHIEVEQKPYTLDSVTSACKQILTKATNNGLSQADVVRALVKGGLEVDAMLAIMDELGYAEVVPAEGEGK